MTSHYLMLILLENTLMQLSLEGCYNLYWAALSPVNRNKVNIGFKRPMFCCLPALPTDSESYVLLYTYLLLILVFSLIPRIHQNHNGDGRIGAACCHDCHPRGTLLSILDL